MQTAVIYARYSSYGQTEQSIEGQVRECTDYANRNDIIILDSYIDRAMTGTNDNRSDFQRMMKDSAKKPWDLVLVYKLDRFSRNKYEMAIHRKTLKDNGIKLVSVKENIPDSPEGIILESLLEGMAEYYSVELAQKVMRGQKETRIKGNYAGGGIPYGYTVSKIGNDKKYVVKEEEAAVVNRIFKEYASGKICRHIIDDLTADGIYGRDGKKFGKNAIYGILQNERYTGVYKHKTDGIFLNTFPRIVPQALFDTVRVICEDNKIGSNAKDDPFLLRGKLYCGYCGKRIAGDSGTSAAGHVIKYYTCSGRKNVKEKCVKKSIRKEELEKIVISVTLKALDKPKNVSALVDKIFEINRERYKTNDTLIILYKEQQECQKARDNIVKAIEEGILTSTTKERLQELEMRLDDIKAKIKIEDAKARIKLSKEEISKFLMKAIKKEPAQIIRLLVKRIVLFDDKIEIYYNTTDRIRPGEEDTHQAFSFYKEVFTYENKALYNLCHGCGKTDIEVELLI